MKQAGLSPCLSLLPPQFVSINYLNLLFSLPAFLVLFLYAWHLFVVDRESGIQDYRHGAEGVTANHNRLAEFKTLTRAPTLSILLL